ncbi:hypothetical protein MYX06_04595 [Patescibacteria group bacterium AH-259-L05]|nr:hypothetical protein [Patescibacteria group bacterium AH-259-L05]
MNKILSILAVVCVAVLGPSIEGSDSARVEIPSYVVPVIVKETQTKAWDQSNAFFIDLEQRIFVSSASLLREPYLSIWLKLSGGWYRTEVWVDGKRGLAALRPYDQELPPLPPVASLAEKDPTVSDTVTALGYRVKDITEEDVIPFDTLAVEIIVKQVVVGAYQTYMVLESIDEKKVHPELKGSPIIGKNGKVKGMILSSAEQDTIYAAPAAGIRDFLKRVQPYLESTENESQ